MLVLFPTCPLCFIIIIIFILYYFWIFYSIVFYLEFNLLIVIINFICLIASWKVLNLVQPWNSEKSVKRCRLAVALKYEPEVVKKNGKMTFFTQFFSIFLFLGHI